METKIQYLLDKYEPKSLNSIKIENDILDSEKDIIFEKESQIPNFVLNSSCPFDKNYCFYGISLKVSTKENIFPKEKYFLKSQQIVELKPIDINKIFDDDTIFRNESPKNLEDKDEEENKDDEDSVHQKIVSSIKNHHYKSYIPKNLEKNEIINKNFNEIDNEWYIIENNTEEGPFNDFSMYNKLYKIYYDSKGNFPNYLLKEKKSDIFMTMNDCFNRLRGKYEYTKKSTTNNEYINQLKLQYMNNLLMYNTQLLKYYQTNTMNNMNSINNKINQNTNKNNAPNKFDNTNNSQEAENANNNIFNNNRKANNRNNINKFNNNINIMNNNRRNNNLQNNRGKNIYNDNGGNGKLYYNNNNLPRYRNKFNRKEKRVDKDHREKKENSDNNNEKELKQKETDIFNKKDETNGENKGNVNEENEEYKDGKKSINVDKFFEK